MLRAIVFAAAALFGAQALAVDITGAGATFPYPIYAKWADAYRKSTGVGLNYQSMEGSSRSPPRRSTSAPRTCPSSPMSSRRAA
jgi:phosphate transport system substrate-binding protein